jgi:predicted nuclease of predicted toxin-antitoxin system
LSESRLRLRLVLDEGVPINVGQAFVAYGHEIILFDDIVRRGSEDTLVCIAAQANDAILVACDGDMRQIAKRHGISNDRFKRLNLIKLSCPEPMAHKRVEFAMSLIEHEWNVSTEKVARRLFLEIGTHFLRSNR